MNALDFIFGQTKKGKKLYESIIDNGYIRKESVALIKKSLEGKDMQAILRLLVVISDRVGRKEERKEDSYAQFPLDLLTFIKNCDNYVRKFDNKKQ